MGCTEVNLCSPIWFFEEVFSKKIKKQRQPG